MSDDKKQVEEKDENLETTDSSKSKSENSEPQHKLTAESIKTLGDAIKLIHAEIDFASRSFNANTDDAANTLNTSLSAINKSFKSSEEHLKKYDTISKTLDTQTSTLALLPKKIDERLALLPTHLKRSIDSNIPQITKELIEAQAKQSESMQETIAKSIELFTTKSNDIIVKLNNDLEHYRNELVKVTELSAKNRMRRLLMTLIIAGGLSAVVSGITSYYINSSFPHTVEMFDNGSVTVQDSHVLVVDPKSPYNKGKKNND